MTFAALLVTQKRKKKSFFAGDQWSTPVSATPTHMLRICVNSRFFFCHRRRKRKSYQKENAEIRFRTLRSATRATCPCPSRLLKKAGENFNYGALKLHYSARKL